MTMFHERFPYKEEMKVSIEENLVFDQ